MTSWILVLICVVLACGLWRIIRAGLERERRQALLHLRRDRTGRVTLGLPNGIDPGIGLSGPAPFEKDRPGSRSYEHASTLPVSFSNSGGWASTDSCLTWTDHAPPSTKD